MRKDISSLIKQRETMQATKKHDKKIVLFVDDEKMELKGGFLMLQKLIYSALTAT